MAKDIILISTAEWHHPFWTNKQHTALELARQGCRILYIDSLGLRKPSVNTRDLRRLFIRLVRCLRRPECVHENIWVCSPLVIPAARSSFIQRLNRVILRVYLRICQLYLNFSEPMIWTYNPLTLRLLDPEDYCGLVYHCVDDISAQPGMDSSQILKWEKKLCKCADLVFVTSKNLLVDRIAFNSFTYYFPNVIDLSYFSSVRREGVESPPADLENLASPRLLFVGAVSHYKVDFELLRDLALRRPEWSIVLIGAIGEGDPNTNIDLLKNLPNLHCLGPRSYVELPRYMACCDVGLLPCRLNQYTANMFPMKFFEYLASGLPVVSSPLPSLREYQSFYTECETASDFQKAIDNILEENISIDVEALEFLLASHTYESRTAKMLALIKSHAKK